MKLWVIDRRKLPTGEVTEYEVVAPIQRTIYEIASRLGEFVRYENHYYPVHPESELKTILLKAKSGDVAFSNRYVGTQNIAASLTKPAAFILTDELGPLAPISNNSLSKG